MNLHNVLKVYRLLRQFSDDESALLATLRGLNDSERELLADELQPERVAAKKKLVEVLTRKIEKCDACNYTRRAAVHKDVEADGYHEFLSSKSSSARGGKKSARAAEMAATLNKNREVQRQIVVSNTCTSALPDGSGTCHAWDDDSLHTDSSYGNYHEFVAPNAQAAGVGD
jgi:hypothetical protein